MRGFSRKALMTMVPFCLTAFSSAEELQSGFQDFSGYAGATEFSVVPRQDELVFYPCSQCHEFMEPDGTIRELMSPHEIEFKHGQGRFWCFACHRLDDRDELVAMNGEPVSFNDSHMVCGGCHGLRHKDWHFGAHGKRKTDFEGERVIYSCTHCHDAHNPVIAQREPMPKPGVRTGLELKLPDRHEKQPVWERHETGGAAKRDDHE